jgi:hypothetical protein
VKLIHPLLTGQEKPYIFTVYDRVGGFTFVSPPAPLYLIKISFKVHNISGGASSVTLKFNPKLENYKDATIVLEDIIGDLRKDIYFPAGVVIPSNCRITVTSDATVDKSAWITMYALTTFVKAPEAPTPPEIPRLSARIPWERI